MKKNLDPGKLKPGWTESERRWSQKHSSPWPEQRSSYWACCQTNAQKASVQKDDNGWSDQGTDFPSKQDNTKAQQKVRVLVTVLNYLHNNSY